VTGLSNGQPLYFSVSAIDAEQREGALCKPVLSRAEDCTPPSSPTNLQFEAKGSQILLTWTTSPEAKSYKVYCLAKGEKYRIPLRVEAPQVECDLGHLAKGKYQVWVAAVDDSGNESRRNQLVDIELK
ncbi:fibronectin type III domain-containing protein, partial [bacterium]|nr:fibronectin type III domain-containing protein [bacterium]